MACMLSYREAKLVSVITDNEAKTLLLLRYKLVFNLQTNLYGVANVL
jgi:hypothetical protein